MKRRDLLKGGVLAGLSLAVPARANDAFNAAFANGIDGTAPVPEATPPVSLPAVVSRDYQRRILTIAQRELERAGTAVWRRDLVGIADFGMPSAFPRLHFANMENGTVRSFLVAHGKGSDPEHDGWLKHFSNTPGSEATSRGGYLTCEWYNGKYGTSIRLKGLEVDNSHALDRAIVMHPAAYVGESMIERWGKIGRSEGCFAMAQSDFNEALWHLSGGRLLYADRIGQA